MIAVHVVDELVEALIAGDGRVIDDRPAAEAQVDAATHAHAGDAGRARGAWEGGAWEAAGAPPAPARGFSPSQPRCQPSVGLVARDGISGLGLIGALLRTNLGLMVRVPVV